MTWWPSSVTYLFVNVTYWNCSPIPYVDQVWWWYVKAFMSYAWQNWQTNRQTDRQTNRQTNILAKNCKFWQVMKGQSEIVYLPKFANMILIVMMIVITEILYVITCQNYHFGKYVDWSCYHLASMLVGHYLPKFTILASMFVCRFVCLSVCLSVSLSVLSSITHERFDISSPNLVHIWNGWAVPVCDIDK